LWEQGKPTEAKHWFMRAAAASHAEAAYELGWLLKNTEQDDLGTTYWWRTSADLGWHGAGYHLAQDLEKQQKTAEARVWYERAAPGHRDAAFRLAELLQDAGERAEARHWYERSARQGHAVAAFRLGCLMMEIQDFKGAGYWWHEADRLGYPGAKPLEIAEMLWARGWPAEAKAWFEEAARNGVHRAAYQLGYLLDSLGDTAGGDHWRAAAANLAAEESRPSANELKQG
jgi:TPR repeat protein